MTRRTPHAALFLDRDGVINVERNYVHRIEDFEFVEGIFDLCRAAADRQMPIVVITKRAETGLEQACAKWYKASCSGRPRTCCTSATHPLRQRPRRCR